MRSDFLKGSCTGTVGVLLKILLNLAVIPMLIKYQGQTAYGFYIFLVTFIELLLVLDLGLTTGLIQRVSSYYELQDTQRIRNTLCNGQWLYLGLSGLLIILGSFLAKGMPHFFNITGIDPTVATIVFQIVVIEAAVNLMAHFYKAILKANCMYQWPNMIEAAFSILVGLGIIVLVGMGHNLIAIMIFRLITAILCLGFCMVKACQVDRRSLQLNFRISLHEMKELWAISFHAMVQRISVYLSYNVDDLVIARFLSMGDIAIVGVIRKILSLPSQICFKILEGIFPIFARLDASQNVKESRFFFLRLTAFTNFLVLVMLLNLVIIYPEIVRILSNGQIPPQSTYLIASAIGFNVWSGIIQMPASNYLFASGMHRYQTYTSLATAVVNFILSILLVQKMGLIGVIVATLIAQCTQHHLLTILMACQRLGIHYRDYIITVYLKNAQPLAALILGLALISYLKNLFSWSLPVTLFPLGLVSLLSLMVWLQYSASKEERAFITEKLAKFRAIKIPALQKVN